MESFFSRSRLLAAALLLILAIGLVACGSAAPTPAPEGGSAATSQPQSAPTEPPAASEPATPSPESQPTEETQEPEAAGGSAEPLEWANDAPWHEPGQQAVGEAAAEAIGIGINTVMFPTTDAYQAAVRTSINTERAFPIFDWWFAYRMRDLVEEGVVADVTPIWEKYIATGDYTEDLMDLFSYDGRAYALPKLLNYWVVFYNKHIFDEYNLQPPTTWDELLTIAETLKSNGVTPFGLDVVSCRWCSFIWFEELLVRTDPQLYEDLMAGKVKYNDPKVLEVMQTWKDLIDRGYFSAPGSVQFSESADPFVKGEFAMHLIGDWWTANVERAGFKAGEDYGIFVVPGITEAGADALIVEGRPVLIAEHSARKEDALKFADFFMSVEGQTSWAKVSEINSPNLKVPAETRPEHLRELSEAVANEQYKLYVRYWEATPPEIVEQVVDFLGQFVIQPETLNQVMDQAAGVADAYWAEQGQ